MGSHPSAPYPRASRRASLGASGPAVDEKVGKVAGLRVAPELADPVGPVGVRQAQDVEGAARAAGGKAWSRALSSASISSKSRCLPRSGRWYRCIDHLCDSRG
jgi:hypothetical protein